MSNVYVVQLQQKRDRSTGRLVERFDLSPAEDYGPLVYLLEHGDSPLRPVPTLAKLRSGLANFTEQDYLLLIGNPCLIGWATALASQASGGRVRLLQWSARSNSYVVVESDLGATEQAR